MNRLRGLAGALTLALVLAFALTTEAAPVKKVIRPASPAATASPVTNDALGIGIPQVEGSPAACAACTAASCNAVLFADTRGAIYVCAGGNMRLIAAPVSTPGAFPTPAPTATS